MLLSRLETHNSQLLKSSAIWEAFCQIPYQLMMISFLALQKLGAPLASYRIEFCVVDDTDGTDCWRRWTGGGWLVMAGVSRHSNQNSN